MKTLPFVLTAFGVLLAPLAPAGEPIKPGVTPEAYQVIKAVSDFHKTLPAAAADIKLTLSQEVPGNPKQESVMKATFAAERPRHFKLQLEGTQGGIAIVCDGQTVWTYLPELKQYTVDTAPMNLEILLRYHDAAPKAMSQLGLLCELFRKEPASLILDQLTSLKVAGSEKVEGIECLRLLGEQEDMDWVAWFEKGDKPMLRKFSFSPLKGMLANAPAEMRERLKGVKLEATVEYGWKDGGKAADGAFAYVPPAGAQKVQHFVENEPEPAGGDPAESGGGVAAGPDTLKGKPAPDFTLETLTGGKLHLAELKGKVVVLDFWASWCGPCVAALPQISEASKARAEKGVVFYAVNQQEEVPEIKAFLQKKNLDVPVALDVEGAAAKLYHVRGIPQTVVIDKEGNVAVVHVGFSPKMKEQLGRELDELLAK
jgi:thiol-disulfide isomerase/thioredoxin